MPTTSTALTLTLLILGAGKTELMAAIRTGSMPANDGSGCMLKDLYPDLYPTQCGDEVVRGVTWCCWPRAQSLAAAQAHTSHCQARPTPVHSPSSRGTLRCWRISNQVANTVSRMAPTSGSMCQPPGSQV
jgi:hypothetical protein